MGIFCHPCPEKAFHHALNSLVLNSVCQKLHQPFAPALRRQVYLQNTVSPKSFTFEELSPSGREDTQVEMMDGY